MSAVGRVAALGERVRVEGFALAGVLTFSAEDEDAVRDAWAGLPGDVAVVVLTPAAARALGPARTSAPERLTVVMPS